jgi:hypothetical protein
MKSDYTHISWLLDISGSMKKIKTDVIGGFNSFLEDQKKETGKLTLTLAKFDDRYEIAYQMAPIEEVKNLTDKTFIPRGMTALLDSLARLVIDTGKVLAEMPESERPEKVLFIIQTDGQENCSRQYTNDKVKEMIEHQKDIYKWEFMYLGANQDGFAVGGAMGMQGATYAATTDGLRGAYYATTEAVKKFRKSSVGTSFSLSQEDIDNASK